MSLRCLRARNILSRYTKKIPTPISNLYDIPHKLLIIMAEEVGFEPTEGCPSPVFKTEVKSFIFNGLIRFSGIKVYISYTEYQSFTHNLAEIF